MLSSSQPKERAIVTGATSGIGRAVAARLGRRGAVVAILGRSEAKADMIAQEVRAAGGTPWIGIVEIADMIAVSDVVARFAEAFGGIDTAVASAGVASTGTLTSTAPEEWHRMINTNLNGTYYFARAVMPELVKTKGSFVAISSDAGVQGAQGYAAYATSKHALHGLIKCMALDYGPQGVRSHAVCPAFVETPMADELLASATPEEVEYFRKMIPLGRFAQPSEVADAVAHLTSAEAAFANGVFYRLDGGSTAGYFMAS